MKRVVCLVALAASFCLGLSVPANAADVITAPNWLKQPTPDNYAAVWPAEAYRRGVGGKALMRCIVTAQGLLDHCSIISESPAGAGFGGAALVLSRYFMMRPQMVGGVAVDGAQVEIPINFVGPTHDAAEVPMPLPTGYLDSNPFLTEAPTPEQIAAAFPQAAVGKAEHAHTVMRCDVYDDGSLHTCEVHAQPEGLGFERATKLLAKDFKVDVAAYDKTQLEMMEVDVPITFFSPDTKVEEKVTKPMWTHAPDPAVVQALYPARAANAGVRSGTAHVECSVAHSGQLVGCSVVSEDPTGLGFGDAALQVAQVMAMNPWTSEGRPVDGAVIRMPVILKLPGTPTPTVATPTASAGQARHDALIADRAHAHYYPDKAARAGRAGVAILDCLVGDEGWLWDCKVVSENPAGYGFGETALTMTPLFKQAVTGPNANVPGTRIRVPFNFKLP